MPTTHPFYRFSPAGVNAGFAPESTRVSIGLQNVYATFLSADPTGLTISNWIKEAKTILNDVDFPALSWGLRLVYPQPYPPITGTQTLTFYVQNDQLLATQPGQRITLTVNLTAGVVTSATYTYPGPLSETGDYSTPLIPVELDVQRALQVYDQNGAAFFPLPYNFQGGVARSGLARGRDWRFDGPNPVPDLPESLSYGPLPQYQFAPLSAEGQYVLSLIDRAINAAYFFDGPPTTEFTDFFAAQSIPNGWTLVAPITSGDFVEVSIFSAELAFKLVGQYYYGAWKFQRFITTNYNTTVFITGPFAGDSLPLEPLTGLVYASVWQDFEFVTFEPSCLEYNEGYNLPIKAGDQLQFNVLPEEANLAELDSCLVGLLDQDGNFAAQVGTATKDCNRFTWFIAFSYDNDDFPLYLILCEGAFENDNIVVLVTPDLPSGATVNTIDALQSWAEQLEVGTLTWTAVSGGYQVVWNIPLGQFAGPLSAGVAGIIETPPFPFVNEIEAEQCCPTQFYAKASIPVLKGKCYQYVLYNEAYSGIEIYSVSNWLENDNAECFSQILEFGGPDGSVVEGFEYFGDWQQRVRIGLQAGGDKPIIEENIYRRSDGTFARPKNISGIELNLHTDYLTVPTQKALFSATRHPNFVLNGQNLSVQGDIEVATIQDFTTQSSYRTVAQMTFLARIQGYQPDNNTCIGC